MSDSALGSEPQVETSKNTAHLRNREGERYSIWPEDSGKRLPGMLASAASSPRDSAPIDSLAALEYIDNVPQGFNILRRVAIDDENIRLLSRFQASDIAIDPA